MTTRPFLVAILRRETPFFDDETFSRRHFEPENSLFWRRSPFSSSLLGEKLFCWATRTFLVTILSRETPFFDDETFSRRHFEPENSLFWRRSPFSSSLLGEKLLFWATRPFLVTILSRKTLFFGDEAHSRHHFEPKNPIF
ncbi:hypothetical protein NSQ96_15675 [Caldifermentibacillus hisashii]|uniref:hypothetical protein n=1 Tax=Caldifermentibacillus hisashii TaxID=996558 RepID=UPI0031FBC286